MSAADTARLLATLDLNDSKFQGGIRRSLTGLGRLDKGVAGVGRTMGRVGKGLGKGAAVIGVGAITGLTLAAKAAIDYQDAFQGVVKTVSASPAKFDEISAAIRRMSTEMPISAIELSAIAEAGGAMGVKANDIEAFTKQVAILATTTNVSADDAATALGQLQNVIGLTGSEFDNFAATLVDLGNKGASTESEILEITRRAGGAARFIGVAKDATIGWAAAAANLGINQELAGTSLQNFFLKSQRVVSGGGGQLKRFAKIAGLSSKDFKKAFGKDASGALEKFVKGLGTMTKGQQLKALQDFFGKGSGITRLITGLAGSIKNNLDPTLKESTKAWFESTAAQKEFDQRNATVRSSITRLKNGLIDAAVSIGEGFTPALGRASDKLATFLKDPVNRAALKSIGEDIGKAIDSIDWDKLLTVAKTLGSAFKPALDAIIKIAGLIASLPPGVIGGGAALVVTDKLTGGAVSSAAGDVVGGLGAALAKNLAASIPLFGNAFVQKVWVVNQGFGMPGGTPGVPGGGGTSEGGAGGAKLGGTAGAGIVITDMHAFNTDIAGQLDKSNSQFAQTAARAFREQANKDTPWDKILVALGLAQPRNPEPSGKPKFGPDNPGFSIDRGLERGSNGVAFVDPIVKAQNESRAAFEGASQAIATGVGKVDATTHSGLSGAIAATRSGLDNATAATRSGTSGTTAATNAGASRIVGAITSNRPIVNVNTSTVVNVTASGVQKSTTTSTRYGEQNGSAGGGGGHAGGQSIAG